MKLKKKIQIKYIAIKSLRTKFDIISKYYDISKFFTTSGKCFPSKIKGKHFSGNQAKFFFDRKVFSVDQLFQWQTNTGKFGKWFPGNHFLEKKRTLTWCCFELVVNVFLDVYETFGYCFC